MTDFESIFRLVDLFRASQAGWFPASAGFERRSIVSLSGQPWTLCVKIHVIEQRDEPLLRPRGYELKASVTLWPPEDRPPDEPLRIDRAAVTAHLSALGYSGLWQQNEIPEQGRFGDFWKDLGTIEDVASEMEMLTDLESGAFGSK